MRKTAAPLARKYSVCPVTLKTKRVKLEVTIDSGPMTLPKEIPMMNIVGKKEMGHYGRKEVKCGDAGYATMLFFEVTDVTMHHREGERGTSRAQNFIWDAKGGKNPKRKVLRTRHLSRRRRETELFSGLKMQQAQFRERNRRADKNCKTLK